MKKAIAIVLFLVVIAGFLSALEIKNSTFFGGVSFDYITADGRRYDTSQPITSTVAGLSVYGGYDVQFGNRWYTRLEYEYLLLPTHFTVADIDVPADADLKRTGSKKRVGGYVVLGKADSDIKFNVGGVITNVTMGIMHNKAFELNYVQDLVGVGLILEGVYVFNKHFTARFGIVPDLTFITIDRAEFGFMEEDGTYFRNSETRTAIFTMGFSVSARAGITYKF